MRVQIKKVIVDNYSDDPKKISSLWIIGTLKSGSEISVFDYECFDLREYVEKEIECLIFAWIDKFKENSKSPIFSVKDAEFLGQYEIPDKWFKNNMSMSDIKKDFSAVNTPNGIILVDPDEFGDDFRNIKKGDMISFNATRMDLLGWFST